MSEKAPYRGLSGKTCSPKDLKSRSVCVKTTFMQLTFNLTVFVDERSIYIFIANFSLALAQATAGVFNLDVLTSHILFINDLLGILLMM